MAGRRLVFYLNCGWRSHFLSARTHPGIQGSDFGHRLPILHLQQFMEAVSHKINVYLSTCQMEKTPSNGNSIVNSGMGSSIYSSF